MTDSSEKVSKTTRVLRERLFATDSVRRRRRMGCGMGLGARKRKRSMSAAGGQRLDSWGNMGSRKEERERSS